MGETDESSVKKRICEVCKKSFNSLTNLKVHLRSHAKTRPYFCCYCKWSFRQHSHLRRHIQTVHKNGLSVKTPRDKFECKECHKFYTKFQTLISHDLVVHQKLQFLTCQLCDVRHDDLDRLMQHYKLMHNDALCLNNGQLYVCSQEGCDSTFENIVQLKEHLLNHDEDIVVFQAEQVQKPSFEKESFDNTGKRLNRRLDKKPNEQVKLHCKICAKRFLSVDSLTLHTVRDHVTCDGISCIKCGKTYKRFSSVRKHIRFLQCPVLRRELENEGVKISDIIQNVEKTTCSICNLSYPSVRLLDIHMRKHSGEKPYECEKCGKTFTQAGNLKTHVQSIHEGNKKASGESSLKRKQYHCDVCGIWCTSAADLNIHMRIHNESQPYKCEHCGRGFSQKGNLNIHITRRVDGACPVSKKSKQLPAGNLKFRMFPVNRRTDENTPIPNAPNYLVTKFKANDPSFATPINVLPSLATNCIVTSSIKTADFTSAAANGIINQYLTDAAETEYAAGASAASSEEMPVIVSDYPSYFIDDSDKGCARVNAIPSQKTSTITKNELVNNCHEVNVITGGIPPEETLRFSMIDHVTTTVDDVRARDNNCSESVVKSSANSLELECENVGNDITNQEIYFLDNPYMCSAYDIFDGNSMDCGKYIDDKENSINCQEVNVISSLTSPFIETEVVVLESSEGAGDVEESPQPCKEVGGISDVTTQSYGDMFNVPLSTDCNVNYGLVNGNVGDLALKGINGIGELNTSTSTVRLPCSGMETNVIMIGQKARAIVSTPQQTNVNNSTKPEHSEENERVNEISDVSIEDYITDFHVEPVRNPSSCKETNVIKGFLSSFDLTNTYIDNNLVGDVGNMEGETVNMEDDSYVCQEVNVITGVNSNPESPRNPAIGLGRNFSVVHENFHSANVISGPVTSENNVLNSEPQKAADIHDISHVCQETYVITSLVDPEVSNVEGVLTPTGTSSDNNSPCKETAVIRIANTPFDSEESTNMTKRHVENEVIDESEVVDENEVLDNMCQVTNVIMGVSEPLLATSVTCKDDLDIMDSSMTCKQTNVIQHNLTSEKEASVELADVSYLTECPYIISQATNVITCVSLPVENTNCKPNVTRPFNMTSRPFNMTSSEVSGLSSTFESTDPFEPSSSFEPSPSFESIEEELVPYESMQNQPTFLNLDETKDFDPMNFNTLYQGLFTSVPTTSTKAQVIVNNGIFNENFFSYMDQPDQSHCPLLSDDENEFTDINWYPNYQLPLQVGNPDNLTVSSVSTVIKNVSGGEVKDINYTER